MDIAMSASQRLTSVALAHLTDAHKFLWSMHAADGASRSPAAVLHDYAGARSAFQRASASRVSDIDGQTPAAIRRQTTKCFAHAGMGVGAAMMRPLDAAFGTSRAFKRDSREQHVGHQAQQVWSAINFALDIGVLGAVGGALSASCGLAGAGAASVIGVMAGAVVAACHKDVSQSRERVITHAVQLSAKVGAIAGLTLSLVPLAAVRIGIEAVRLVGGVTKLTVGGSFAAVAGMVGCAAGLWIGLWVYQAQRRAAARGVSCALSAAPPPERFLASGASTPLRTPSSPSLAPSASADTLADWDEVRQAIARGRHSGTLAPLTLSDADLPPSPPQPATVPLLGFDDDLARLWQRA